MDNINIVLVIATIPGFCAVCGCIKALWHRASSRKNYEEYQCSDCKVIRQVKVK